ncbi:helix-turn-helix domain-containing protein [Pseudoroseicyclus tamaricis]|uniref:Helix-turn-helix domain-containing protein n=1 Tax=Pseudoroseicyclus tamaricis TaxID=2705421 RepID=A0A6B2K2Q8_9RHOB|nr:helix-turn-helix domain-containing protein [Pseudoroseicyclus tamaricis]NDV00756.1 helix-turn-helix domain-containing protein [Pseudoroseicyclus tamaricis]
MDSRVVDKLTALAHAQRLALFRLLMRRYPDAVPAGELAAALGVAQNTLSNYLSSLRNAGLIAQSRAGRSLLYRIDMAEAAGLMGYLFSDCCRGRPELCPPIPRPMHRGSAAMNDRKYNVLFICTGNSARSIFGESLLRHEAGDRFNAYSAGTHPYSQLNPFAVEMLQGKGHDISPLRAKTIAEFQGEGAPVMDFVFTVCDAAANEDCPAWPGQPISAHWGLPDPVKATGTDAEKKLAFQQAYAALRNRILAFTALPIDSLSRSSLQKRVDEIAQDMETQ